MKREKRARDIVRVVERTKLKEERETGINRMVEQFPQFPEIC